MHLKVNDETWRIQFRHEFYRKTWEEKGATVRKDIPHQPNVTTCNILNVKGKEESSVCSGKAVRNVTDNFNKEIGRKLSMTRAIMGLSKDVRRQIWQAYFSRR